MRPPARSALPGAITTIFAMTFTAGCIMVPVPVGGHTGAYKAIDDETLKPIEVGRTTRADVVLQLGAPTRVENGAFVYGTEKRDWLIIVTALLPTLPTQSSTINTYRPLIVEFDERAVVKAVRWGESRRGPQTPRDELA